MRYREQLEHAALTLATTSSAVAATVSSTCGVVPCDRAQFRRLARSVAARFAIRVVVEEDEGLLTASFFRSDDTDVAI